MAVRSLGSASAAAFVLLLTLAGCGGSTTAPVGDAGGLGVIEYIPIPDPDRPPVDPKDIPTGAGAILVRFDVGPDYFHVWETNENSIRQLVDIYEGRKAFTHLVGLIRPGMGENDHNSPWSWYLSPGVLVNIPGDPLTSFQGSLSAVEAKRDELVAQDKYYVISSPNAAMTALYDFR